MEIFSPSPPPLRPPPPAFIRPPPPCFDYRSAVLADTQSAVAALHPELMPLVHDGSLVLVPKRRYGPVPDWRRWFVEPEKIWVLGTSHLSEKSADDVAKVVRSVKPDNVVVELCRSRAGIMYASDSERNEDGPLLSSNMFALSGAKFFGAINRSINLGGQSALALRLLLAFFSSKISSGANRPFGDEFRSARKVAEEIGAQIVLGDRPIEITLERAWKSLNFREKFTLITSLFRGITSPSLKTTNNSSAVEENSATSPFELYEKLSKTYPSLLQPLIHERDTYIAWSLKRSKAVKDSKRVVGIIGKGHMNGVVYALMADQGDLRFRDLVGQERSNDWVKNLIIGLIRDTVIGFVLWALYESVMGKL
ncbi:hypothetical protein LUZ60_011797 [Juncus effusus]|nr:hypothetical protein LUZ60_011797 [Juncus effusus]